MGDDIRTRVGRVHLLVDVADFSVGTDVERPAVGDFAEHELAVVRQDAVLARRLAAWIRKDRKISIFFLGEPAFDEEDTLKFSVLQNVRPMIETMPLDQATQAYARMISGAARFRMVLYWVSEKPGPEDKRN